MRLPGRAGGVARVSARQDVDRHPGRLGDRVLRPAEVIVSRAEPSTDAE